MNNTNIPIPSQSFHTFNMPTTPMKRLMYIMLIIINCLLLNSFIRYYKKMIAALLQENDSSVIQTTSETFRLICIVHC